MTKNYKSSLLCVKLFRWISLVADWLFQETSYVRIIVYHALTN